MEDINSIIQGQPLEVYAAVAEPLQPGDGFYDAYVQFNQSQVIAQTATHVAIISLLLMACAFIYLIYFTYRRDPEEIMAQRPLRMYTDVYTLLFFYYQKHLGFSLEYLFRATYRSFCPGG